MSQSMSILTVYICLYLVAAISSFRIAGEGPRWKGGFPLLFGVLLLAILWPQARTAIYGAGAVVSLVFLFVCLPLLVFGFGRFTGSLASFLPGRPVGFVLRALVIAAPVLAVLWGLHERSQRIAALRDEALAAQAAFQLTDVTVEMAGVPIRLPVSPQIILDHACKHPESRVASQRCVTDFRRAVGLRFQDGVDGVPAASRIQLRALSDVCVGNCLETEVLRAWCAQRTDIAKPVWCRTEPSPMVFFGTEPRAPAQNAEITEVPGRDIRIACRDRYDGRQCEASFVVTTGVYATVFLYRDEVKNARELAEDMERHTKRLWREITLKAAE